MPYILQTDRERYALPLSELGQVVKQGGISNGDLNYLMSQLALMYLSKHGTSYNILSDVIKAFECAKLEFYARVVRPYEDQCIERNGDIYHLTNLKKKSKKVPKECPSST